LQNKNNESLLLFLNGKGKPILKITTPLRSCKPVDVIIISQENRGHPLPQKIVDRGANHTYSITTIFYFYFYYKRRIKIKDNNLAQLSPATVPESLLVILKPNRIIHKRTDANYSSFHLRVFLALSNPQGQRPTSILSIPHDNLREPK
jgi:hypothetical protein